jgi:hypothetical protein
MSFVRYVHHDETARRYLAMDLEARTEPGQAAVSRLDPGRCEPGSGPSIDELSFRVFRVVLYGRKGETLHALSRADGSLSPGAAEALAREFEARYNENESLQQEVDQHIIDSIYGDNSPED